MRRIYEVVVLGVCFEIFGNEGAVDDHLQVVGADIVEDVFHKDAGYAFATG